MFFMRSFELRQLKFMERDYFFTFFNEKMNFINFIHSKERQKINLFQKITLFHQIHLFIKKSLNGSLDGIKLFRIKEVHTSKKKSALPSRLPLRLSLTKKG